MNLREYIIFLFSYFNLGILCHFCASSYYYCCYFLRGYYIFVRSLVLRSLVHFMRTRTFFRSLRSFQQLFFFLQPVFSEFYFLIFVETTFLLIQVYMYVRKQFRRRRFSVKTHFSHTSLVSVWIQLSVKVENHAFFKFSVKVDTKFS